MPTIREIVDGRTLEAASPIAEHVSKHIQDPFSATKDQFGKLQKAKLNYDLAREETQRSLTPVQSVITHLSQMHGLQPNMPTPGMSQGNNGGQVDPAAEEETDENGNVIPPRNMQQSVGSVNQNRPSLTGHEPGAAPKMEGQVVPPKLGMASPGKPQAQNSPAPNPQKMQYNPAAKPPKGNRSLPGAKGPGDAKVANRTKKAQNNSPGKANSLSRPIKVTVHASSCIPVNSTSIEASRSFSDLKFHGSIAANRGSMPLAPGGALGPSGVMPKANPATGASIKSSKPFPSIKSSRPFPKAKKIKALEELSDKATGTQNQVALNPVSGLRTKLDAEKIDVCKSCGKLHVEGKCMKAAGSRGGAKKGWSTRGKGHLSRVERDAHYSSMKARDFSQKQRKKLAKTGAAMPGGGYPIANRKDLANAKQAIGRAKNRAATIRHINKRAKALGAPGFGQDMDAVAPPGREDQVKTLKQKFGKKAAFKIAWNSYNHPAKEKHA